MTHEELKSLEYDELLEKVLQAYAYRYGEAKLKEIADKIYASSKLADLMKQSVEMHRLLDIMTISSALNSTAYFLFSKNSTVFIGAVIALEIWNHEVNFAYLPPIVTEEILCDEIIKLLYHLKIKLPL